MFSGPLFRWEYRATARNRHPFVLRTFVGALFCGVALVAGLLASVSDPGQNAASGTLLLGRMVFVATTAAEVIVLAFLIPALIGGAIAEERERDTVTLLLLTRLSPLEIVLTKTFARWLSTINLILIGVPIIVASAWAAGLEAELALALVGLASSSAFMATLAILASASRQQAANARAEAAGWTFGWLLAPPFLSIMPVGTGTRLGMLLADLKSFCRLVAPSSPLSLVTDNRWLGGPPVSSLEGRIAEMVALQAIFGLFVLGLATTKLKARETNPNWLDPTRGYRPPCGDDPIFWREYELPIRRGSGTLIGLRLRYLVILIKAILLSLLALVGIIISLAIPIGTVAATVYYGYEALDEAWQYRDTTGGRLWAKRMHFNLLVRGATCLLALLPMLNMHSLISGRITTERDKKTWELILSTPLTGAEILGSKAFATLYGLRHTILPFLPVIWVAGIALGVVWPPGIVLAAIDLGAAAWLFQAMGLHSSLKPGASRPASSQVALLSLALSVVHIAMLAIVLATPRELAQFASWDASVRIMLSLAVLLVPVLSGAVAWVLTRRTLDRFDEWVGRPARSPRTRT